MMALVSLLLLVGSIACQRASSADVAASTAEAMGICNIVSSSSSLSIRVGGLLEMHETFDPTSGQCLGFGDWATVQQSTSFNFMIQRAVFYLKRILDPSIPPEDIDLTSERIVVGGLALDTCASALQTVQGALLLATDSSVYRTTLLNSFFRSVPSLGQSCESLDTAFAGSAPLIGVIGPTSTNGVTAVSPFLSNFAIPQVSYWATSTLFDNVADYPFLFRTVPSDEFQAAAIADLIEHLGWTHVSLVAADDEDYSGRGFELIRAQALARGTFCFDVESRFSTVLTFISRTLAVVNAIKASAARVVILYAPISSAKLFLQLCQQLNIRDKIFVGSHDWVNRIEYPVGSFQTYAPILGLAPRAVASSVVLEAVEDMRRALRTPSFVQSAVQTDPWLRTYVERQLQCTVNTTMCSVLSNVADFVNRSRPCELSDFQRFQPRNSMVIAEALALGALALGWANYDLITPEDLMNDIHPNGTAVVEALRDLVMPCRNHTSSCRVFDSLQRTAATYYIQNAQKTSAGFFDIVSIGLWESDSGFQWYPDHVLDMKEHGSFAPSLTNLSAFPINDSRFPTSNCSQTCTPGQHRSFNSTLPVACCWTCVACEGATFSNTTNVDSCMACPLGYGSNGVECSPYPLTQHQLSDPENAIVLAVACVGFVLTLMSLLYFHRHPNAPLVRAADLTLSTISMVAMLIGHALVAVVLIPDTITTRFCTLSAVLPEPIKVVVASAVLVKTKRVNTVFKSMEVLNHRKKQRVLLGNPMQILTIAFLTLIDLVLVFLYAEVDPPQAMRVPSSTNVLVYCDLNTLWVGLLSAYNMLLLSICVVLAFLTRNLPEAYNEAQLLYLASVTGFVVWLGLFPALILTGRTLRPTISAIFLEGQLLAFWLCLYLPRLVMMVRHKKYRNQLKSQSSNVKQLSIYNNSSTATSDSI